MENNKFKKCAEKIIIKTRKLLVDSFAKEFHLAIDFLCIIKHFCKIPTTFIDFLDATYILLIFFVIVLWKDEIHTCHCLHG